VLSRLLPRVTESGALRNGSLVVVSGSEAALSSLIFTDRPDVVFYGTADESERFSCCFCSPARAL
jgi:hypothetical protein